MLLHLAAVHYLQSLDRIHRQEQVANLIELLSHLRQLRCVLLLDKERCNGGCDESD